VKWRCFPEHKLALTIVVFRDDTLSLIKLKQQRMKLPETVWRWEAPIT
jgi:hypothetical protein